MASQQPFPRERLENELQLAGQKLDNLIEKRTTIEREIRDVLSEIQSLEQSLTEKKRRLTRAQQTLQATRAKIDQVDKIRRLLLGELEKSEEERDVEFQEGLKIERKRREEGRYGELESRVFREILREVRARTRRQFSEKEDSAYLNLEVPISIHDRIENLDEYEKVTPTALLAVIDELAFQHDLLQQLPRDEDEDPEFLKTLNQAGMAFFALNKILGKQEGPSWEFQNFAENLESAVTKITTTYYRLQDFVELRSLEVSYSVDSHITAVCKLISDKTENKIDSVLEPLRIGIEERLGDILKQVDSSKKLFLNELFKEAVLKNKLFSLGTIEGVADLGKTKLLFSERDVFGRDAIMSVKEIQKKLDVISLAIAEIFLENDNIRRALESRLS
ncbi:MAG: hypothetical protein ACE5OZ_23655 [Candidatus Heimdallarchaeota archaeon]